MQTYLLQNLNVHYLLSHPFIAICLKFTNKISHAGLDQYEFSENIQNDFFFIKHIKVYA